MTADEKSSAQNKSVSPIARHPVQTNRTLPSMFRGNIPCPRTSTPASKRNRQSVRKICFVRSSELSTGTDTKKFSPDGNRPVNRFHKFENSRRIRHRRQIPERKREVRSISGLLFFVLRGSKEKYPPPDEKTNILAVPPSSGPNHRPMKKRRIVRTQRFVPRRT